MEETQGAGNGTPQFGVTSETQSKNSTPFKAGFTKSVLVGVKKEEIGKTDKYTVLTFTFKDMAGDKTYRHSEFMVKPDDTNREKKTNGLNVRIKHIFEAFAPFPTGGIGVGATSWEDFFDKVANAFNTGNNGKPVFNRIEADKEIPVIVWLKTIYDKKNNLGFPLSPNFIERVKTESQVEPLTLVIDKRYDKIEQTDAKATGDIMGVPGQQGAIKGTNDYGFD